MKTRIHERDYLLCDLDDEVPVLKHRWLRHPTSEEFMSGLMAVYHEYMKIKDNYEDLKWLADTTRIQELDPDVKEWLNSNWDQMLFIDAGVKTHAVIRGPDIYADYPMEAFKLVSTKKFNDLGIRLEVFEDEEKAYEWLTQK